MGEGREKGLADGKKELLEMTLVRTWKKKDGKISGSIFDPEKGAALPGGGGGGGGGGRLVGLAEEKSEKKEAACSRSTRGLHFEGTYNGETVSRRFSLSLV